MVVSELINWLSTHIHRLLCLCSIQCVDTELCFFFLLSNANFRCSHLIGWSIIFLHVSLQVTSEVVSKERMFNPHLLTLNTKKQPDVFFFSHIMYSRNRFKSWPRSAPAVSFSKLRVIEEQEAKSSNSDVWIKARTIRNKKQWRLPNKVGISVSRQQDSWTNQNRPKTPVVSCNKC